MLSGKDFIILNELEVNLICKAFIKKRDKATYTELAKLGILDLMKKMESFLYGEDS
ncbi:MAG: hypothetical protein ACFFCW_00305 [Candidatus Hodarchaeota archaeon]